MTQRPGASRLSLATAAVRPGMPGKMLLAGPSGAGKTYTGLLIASALCPEGKIVVGIDTEKGSMKTYADEFKFHHLPWGEPFNAVELQRTIEAAEERDDIGVIVVDSFTHFWRGKGGILDVASGKWTGWNEARPMHADLVDAVLSSSKHIILCARMKQEHEQVEENGRKVVRKLGMGIQQDDNLEYEVNVAIEMDMAHTMFISKSRTRAVPVGSEFPDGHAERFAGVYRDWLAGGEPVVSYADRQALVEVLNRIEDAPTRQVAKDEFLITFGRPEFLLASRLPEAQEWVADRLLGVEPTPNRAEGEVPPETAPKDETHEHGEEPPAPDRQAPPAAAEGVAGGSDAQPGPDAAETAQTATETAGGEAPPAEPEPPTGEEAALRARFVEQVAKMTVVQLRDGLVNYGRAASGTVKHQRAALVDCLVKAETPI